MIKHLIEMRARAQSSWEALHDDARKVLLWLHVTAAEDGTVPADDAAAASALELAKVLSKPHEAARAASLAESALAWCDGDDAEFIDDARSLAADRYLSAGRDDDARRQAERLLASREVRLGSNHPRTLDARHALALALVGLDRFAEARVILQTLLDDYEGSLSSDRRELLSVRKDHATALKGLGLYKEALVEYRALLSDQQRLIGHLHPDTLSTALDLANTLSDLGHADEAIQAYQALVAEQRQALAPDDPDALIARNNLALAERDSGRIEESLGTFEKLLVDSKRLLGIDHPETLAIADNLAWTLLKVDPLDRSRAAEAHTRLQEVLSSRERVLGPNHPDTLKTRAELAMIDVDFGSDHEAEGLYEESVADRERFGELLHACQRALGEDNPLTMRTRRTLAVYVERVARFEGDDMFAESSEATTLLAPALRTCRRRFEHAPEVMLPDLLAILRSLAFRQVNRPIEALASELEGLRAYCRVHAGSNHEAVQAIAALTTALARPIEQTDLRAFYFRTHDCLEMYGLHNPGDRVPFLESLLMALTHTLLQLDFAQRERVQLEREAHALLGVAESGRRTTRWLGSLFALVAGFYQTLGSASLSEDATAKAHLLGYTSDSTYEDAIARETQHMPPPRPDEAIVVEGQKYFVGMRARGRDLVHLETASPGFLSASRWVNCDLDDTEWPAAMDDVVIIDSSLRNSRWNLHKGRNIRVFGTRKVPMRMREKSDALVVDVDPTRVLARVDGLRVTGQISGLALHQVAGSDVGLGEVDDWYWDQTELPLKFPGTALCMEGGTIMRSYLDRLTLYIDGHDVNISHNGLPDRRLGRNTIRLDFSNNVAT